MSLIFAMAIAAAVALVGLVTLSMRRPRDETVIDITDDARVGGSYDELTRRGVNRLLTSIDEAFDDATVPPDTTAVLCVVSTVAGRVVGPTVVTAPVDDDLSHVDRPWSVVTMPGTVRLGAAANADPEELEDRLVGLTLEWVSRHYTSLTALEGTRRPATKEKLHRAGERVREGLVEGLSIADVIGSTRMVASLLLISAQRQVGEPDVEVILTKVLAGQWMNHNGRLTQWRESTRSEVVVVPTVLSV